MGGSLAFPFLLLSDWSYSFCHGRSKFSAATMSRIQISNTLVGYCWHVVKPFIAVLMLYKTARHNGGTLQWVSVDVLWPHYGWSMHQASALLLVPDRWDSRDAFLQDGHPVEESHWYPSSTWTDAGQNVELWCHHQVCSWEGDACCWCAAQIFDSDWSRAIHHIQITSRRETGVPEDNPRWSTPTHTCWHNSDRMVMSWLDALLLKEEAVIIPPLVWEKVLQATWRTHRNHQVPVPCKAMHILA